MFYSLLSKYIKGREVLFFKHMCTDCPLLCLVKLKKRIHVVKYLKPEWGGLRDVMIDCAEL